MRRVLSGCSSSPNRANRSRSSGTRCAVADSPSRARSSSACVLGLPDTFLSGRRTWDLPVPALTGARRNHNQTIPRLEHALLDVSDLSRSLSSYRTLIPEWTVRWSGSTDSGSRWIHFGSPTGDQPGYLSLYEIPGDDSSLAIEHVGIAHPDVEGLVRRLEEAGICPVDTTEDGAYRRAYFADPDGHQVEFVQKLLE
jgi:catechol 2,3-dioxygenase-like lactoylglutathione lyase family enzyme